jgi:hypothetical protein
MDVKYTLAPLESTGPQSLAYELNRLSYTERRKFFAQRVRPKYPRFQYKFMSLPSKRGDKRKAYLRDILVENRLWLSSPLDFNDPFDMSAKVILEGTTAQFKGKFKRLIDTHATDHNWSQRRKLLTQFMVRGKDDWLRSMKRIFAERQKKTGMCCFAGDPRSILMWSHYANNHTGVCLQFEVVKDLNTFLEAIPVDYVDKHPIYNWVSDSDEQYRQILLSKFSVWNYEKESRIIKQESANTYIRFAPVALVGLIMGSRIDETTFKVVDSLLKERRRKGHPDIKVYRAHKHQDMYKLVIRRN